MYNLNIQGCSGTRSEREYYNITTQWHKDHIICLDDPSCKFIHKHQKSHSQNNEARQRGSLLHKHVVDNRFITLNVLVQHEETWHKDPEYVAPQSKLNNYTLDNTVNVMEVKLKWLKSKVELINNNKGHQSHTPREDEPRDNNVGLVSENQTLSMSASRQKNSKWEHHPIPFHIRE